MKIRKACNLEKLYHDMIRDMKEDSPELVFIQSICAGKIDDAVGMFREKKMFWNEPPVIDTPYGRFEGLDGIRRFAEGFILRFNATSAEITPVFQTISGGRVALEIVVNFVVNNEIEEVPMFIVADLRTPKLLEEVRIYCHYSFVPDLTPYRKPIFQPAHYEMGDPALMTGAMRCYYEALHHAPYCSAERIHKSFAPDCIVGGYEPWGSTIKSREEMSQDAHNFGHFLSTYIPACVGMRYETLIDDGRTCVIEWVHLVSRQGQEERNRIAMSAISAYTRNDDGYLCGVRICDYAGHESEIDWTKTPVSKEEAYSINLIDEFPKGCGMKPQIED